MPVGKMKLECYKCSYMRILLFISVCLLWSCEDVIQVDLENGGVALVVDAWVDDLPIDQKIRLSLSQPYFDRSAPPIVTDASIMLTRQDGETFEFIHDLNGTYIWVSEGQTLGQVGDSFVLAVAFESDNYTATATINRVPEIDSIGIEFREDEIFADDGLYAQFFSRDPVGLGDTYWIKTFRNGAYLEKSQELNLAYDAGFDAGTGVDGLIFIPPIRELVNELSEDLLPTPYAPGDEIRVEIHSISNAAFDFLERARDQINNGDNGIFSIPLANTRTNVSEANGRQVLGFFNVAAVSSMTEVVEE